MSEEQKVESTEEVQIIDEEATTASGSIEEPQDGEVELPSDAPAEGVEEEVSKTEETAKETPPSEEPQKSLIEEYTAKFQEAGEITEEMYSELASKGYDKETVDVIKAGIDAKSEASAKAVLESAGTSAEDFSKATEWAKENWSEEQIVEFNTAIGSTDGAAQKLLIQSLMSSFEGASPTIVEPVHAGATGNNPNTKGYDSMDAMIEDMHDRRYEPGTAYFKAVQAKAARSKF